MPLRGLLAPRSLDDCGSLSAAMIKATRAGLVDNLRPFIDTSLAFISKSSSGWPTARLRATGPWRTRSGSMTCSWASRRSRRMGKLTG